MTLTLRFIASLLLTMTVYNSMAQSMASWRETTHDFGTFDESDGDKSCWFVVTNTGDKPLVISRVQSSCGCTVAEYNTVPIAPGKSDSIRTTYSPTGRPGSFEKTVWVFTNSTPNKTRLIVKGKVMGSPESVNRYFPVPAGSLHFTNLTMAAGEVKKGILRNNLITAYNASSDTLVVSIDNNTSHIDTRAIPDTVPPGGTTTITFYFNSLNTPVWGINDDHLTISARPIHSNETCVTADANVVANVVEDFSYLSDEQRANAPICSVMTDKMIFDNLVAGSIAEGTLTLINTGRNDLIVRRVMSNDKALKTKIDKTLVKNGEKATISLKVNPDKINGNVLNSRFTIITNDPVNPCITVRVVGEIDKS